mmetsp:Transcript_26059/g.80514  ORF Transcript_26059/g.80514 Transcript_26059/m.80514 type:complete len:367 (-) Transcript_26059:1248-2348(-)
MTGSAATRLHRSSRTSSGVLGSGPRGSASCDPRRRFTWMPSPTSNGADGLGCGVAAPGVASRAGEGERTGDSSSRAGRRSVATGVTPRLRRKLRCSSSAFCARATVIALTSSRGSSTPLSPGSGSRRCREARLLRPPPSAVSVRWHFGQTTKYAPSVSVTCGTPSKNARRRISLRVFGLASSFTAASASRSCCWNAIASCDCVRAKASAASRRAASARWCATDASSWLSSSRTRASCAAACALNAWPALLRRRDWAATSASRCRREWSRPSPTARSTASTLSAAGSRERRSATCSARRPPLSPSRRTMSLSASWRPAFAAAAATAFTVPSAPDGMRMDERRRSFAPAAATGPETGLSAASSAMETR